MSYKQRLELDWVGKDKINIIEPRILIRDEALSIGKGIEDKNLLIQGDNLLALKALEKDYSNKIKCIYIDPPFNTGQAFEHYDDGVEHSLWLSLMRERIIILHKLLRQDGLFWMHLDDSEVHYAKVLIDEIFGRNNFVSHISYERSGAAGLGLGGFLANTSEHILLYKKELLPPLNVMNSQPLEKKTIQRYNNALIKAGERKLVREFVSKSNGMPVKVYEHSNFEIKKISLSNYAKREAEIRAELAVNFDFLFRTNQIQKENAFQKDIVGEMDKKNLYTVDYTPSRGKYSGIETTLYYYNAELFAWLKDTASLEEGNIVKHFHLTDFWSHEDIPKADIANEGGVKFSRGKKPENLLKRIIEISTSEGDYVLDSFLGSGTTAAVAHKLKRKWIGIEMGDQCLTHCHKRLKNVVNGKDVTGIKKKVEWNGGGGFQFLRLAPSLLQKDDLGNWVINNEYNALQLAEAVCQHENFKFFPHESVYWKQGYSGEKDFIFVTTQFLTSEHLDRIQDQMQKDETLLVCAKAFRVKKEKYKNITLKKIPQMLLGRCEFGRDDYSLNIREEVQEELGMDLDV